MENENKENELVQTELTEQTADVQNVSEQTVSEQNQNTDVQNQTDDVEQDIFKQDVSEVPVSVAEQNQKKKQKPSKDKGEKKKKKHPFLKFLLGIFVFLFVIILAIVLHFVANSFIREDITNVVPANFSVHLRTDSVWDSVEPLIDLKATEIILAEQPLSQYREMILQFRESEYRNSKLLKLALSRRVDAMVYDKDFLAVLDMGWLSGASRFVPLALNFISIENLSYIKNAQNSYFEYNAGGMIVYVKLHKNLVIVTTSKSLFDTSTSMENSSGYTPGLKAGFKEKLTKPFSITADGRKILEMVAIESSITSAIAAALPEKDLATIDFGISNHNVNLSVRIPLSFDKIEADNPIAELMKRESTVPSLVPKLPESIQYYTVFSAGTLEELKNAFFYAAPASLEIEKNWNTAQNLTKIAFNETLENLVFSWTGTEYAVLGLEDKAEPVFVIKVADEERRRYVFDKIFSSIILKNNTNLLIDNVRIPQIQFPKFIDTLLKCFGIRLATPYYMVKDGYIYFSQSAENLAAINAAIKNGTRLAKNEMWKEASADISQYSTISLYYDLERSIPFFIKKNTLISNVLGLYNIGRMDVQVKGSEIVLQLSAIECKETSATGIVGFPISLSGKATTSLYKSNQKNGKNVYWLEGGDTIKTFNASDLSTSERSLEKIRWIIPASDSVKNKGDLWCITNDGTLYLVNEKLADVGGFPLITGEIPRSDPTVYKDGILFAAKGKKLVYVSSSKEVKEYVLDSFDDVSSTPVVFGDSAVVYEKSFMGGLHIVNLADSSAENDFIETEGIGFGSPAVVVASGEEYIGFLNQAGSFSLWKRNGYLANNFPVDLNGIFYDNVYAVGNDFVALAADGTLCKISLDGEVVKIKIPYFTAEKSFVTIADYNNDSSDEIFVCGDGNSIYGFSDSLELLSGFPLSGYGVPVFIDLNSDKKPDCMTLSLDNTLYGWRVN